MAENPHSRFGGSIAKRWLNCPGSVALCDTVPPLPGGIAAQIGTAAHALAEECLKTNTDARDHEGEFFPRPEQEPDRWKAFIAESDMIAAVQVYLDAVRNEMRSSDDAELYVEQKFTLDVKTAEPGEVFGSNDAMVFHPATGRLRVFDYKHGQGSVDADDNPQLKFYALGAIFSRPDWVVREVVCTIVQPRDRDGDAPAVRDWAFDVIYLFEFQGEIEAGVRRAKLSEPITGYVKRAQEAGAKVREVTSGPQDEIEVFRAGEWCRYCSAASVCPAREQAVLQAAQLDFASVVDITTADLPAPQTFDTARLGQILKAGELLNGWLRQIEEYVEALVLAGTPVPGWKAVEKIGRAKWIEDPAEIVATAEMLFGIDAAQIMPPKLATIGEAEKLLKAAGATKAQIDDFKLKFTIKESSGLTIAPDSDRRPAVDAVARDFGSVDTAAL